MSQFIKTLRHFCRSETEIVGGTLAIIIPTVTTIGIHELLNVSWIGTMVVHFDIVPIAVWICYLCCFQPRTRLERIAKVVFVSAHWPLVLLPMYLWSTPIPINREFCRNDAIAVNFFILNIFALVPSGFVVLFVDFLCHVRDRWLAAADAVARLSQ